MSANLSCAVMDMCRYGIDRSRLQTFVLMSVGGPFKADCGPEEASIVFKGPQTDRTTKV